MTWQVDPYRIQRDRYQFETILINRSNDVRSTPHEVLDNTNGKFRGWEGSSQIQDVYSQGRFPCCQNYSEDL
ncbi:hypothetical protein TNCT_398771 [Trichonephila clavata]|uniref:Uncharacterized protein n=1 Tax=Trichonephila clavata TaxID=2740835 RepID=A0A8X6KQL8_TRICU|nr:hypothetical protein TNCT_398771 [Trichonephila clavata]